MAHRSDRARTRDLANFAYALMEGSGYLRKARDLSVDELRACHAACSGDVNAMAERLEVSGRGLRLRLKELGLV